MNKLHHAGVQNADRIYQLITTDAADCIGCLTPEQLHTVSNISPGSCHPHDTGRFSHMFHQLLLCLQGQCTVVHGSGSFILPAGSAGVFAPHVHYTLSAPENTSPALLSIFEAGHRWTFFAERTAAEPVRTTAMLNARTGSREREILAALTGDPAVPALSFSRKKELLAGLVASYRNALVSERNYRRRNRLGEAGSTEKERLGTAMHAMIKRYPADISIRELADICSISSDHFGKIFKKVYGVPPKEWMTNYRIYRAILLMNGGLPFGTVSEQVGFGDQYYFSKVFRQYTGYSPTEYRSRFLSPAK